MIKTKFWLYSVLVVLLVAANFYYTSRRDYEGVRTTAQARLGQAEKDFLRLEDDAEQVAVARAQAAAASQPVTEAIEAAVRAKAPPAADAVTEVNTSLGEAAARSSGGPTHSLLVLATPDGAGRLDIGKAPVSAVGVPDLGPLKDALGGRATAGLVSGPGGGLLRVAAAPVTTLDHGQTKVLGAVLLGYPLDADAARALHDGVGADVTFAAGKKVVGSSAPLALHADLLKAVAGSKAASAVGFGRLGHVPILAATAPVLGVKAVAGFARRLPLAGVDGAAAILSIPVRAALARINEYQFLQVAAAGLLLLLALIWAFFIAQGATGPAKRLSEALSRAAAGDLKARVEAWKFRGVFRGVADKVNAVLDQVERQAPGVADQILAPKDTDISSVLGGGREPTPPPTDAFPFGPASDAEPAPAPDARRAGPEPAEPAPAASRRPRRPTASRRPAPAGCARARRLRSLRRGVRRPGGSGPGGPGPGPGPRGRRGNGGFFSDATRVVSLDEMQAQSATPGAGPRPGPAPAPSDDPFAAAMAADDGGDEDYSPDATVVAKVPDALLQATARSGGAPAAPRDPDEAHFRDVFRDFVATRQRCGEAADGLTFDKFATKLRKNRDAIKQKHGARSVRFQVYVKDGKAALKATPIK